MIRAKAQREPRSKKIAKYFPLLAWLSQRLIRPSPRLIRPLADSGGVLAQDTLQGLDEKLPKRYYTKGVPVQGAAGSDPLVSIPLCSKENGYDHQRT